MFFDDHKKAIATIIGKRSSKGDRLMLPTPMKLEHSMSEEGEPDGKHLAAEDILGAHHAMSAEQLMNALGNFIDLHLHAKEGNVPVVPDKEPKRPSL